MDPQLAADVGGVTHVVRAGARHDGLLGLQRAQPGNKTYMSTPANSARA